MLKMMFLSSLLLVGLFLQTPARTAAFTPAFAQRKAAVSKWSRRALIYMPDGTKVIEDDDTTSSSIATTTDDWMTDSCSSSSTVDDPLLEYLNRPDFRGPLAVLCAAHKHIEIATIQHVHVNSVTLRYITIEAICASGDGMSCVNVLVQVNFPSSCESETEVIDNLGVLYQQASAVLEQQGGRDQTAVREDSKRLAEEKAAEEGMSEESKMFAAKQATEAKQRALLAARLRHEVNARALIRPAKMDSTDHAETVQPVNRATKEQVAQDLITTATKRGAEAKQRALLEARLRDEEKVRAAIRERQAKQNAILKARKQPNSPEVEEALKKKYGAMSIQERAFCILVDLGMVEITPDP
jgi:hypothetical protein